MKKLIICQGIPGSGKTYYAKNWVLEDPEHRVRLNFDDLRNMMGKYKVPSREVLIYELRKSFIHSAMWYNYDIIIDNLNLYEGDLNFYRDIVDKFNNPPKGAIRGDIYQEPYEIEYKTFFDTPLEVCIDRDKERSNSIGASVIAEIYEKFKSKYPLSKLHPTFKTGDMVKIKDIKWYEENKNDKGDVPCMLFNFHYKMSKYCGMKSKITRINENGSYMLEIDPGYNWTEDMFEYE